MISNDEIKKIREILDNTHRPLIFFDDDPDGLCSFLMVYKYIGDGKGIPIKTSPDLNTQYLRNVEEYAPDRIIILDKPQVSEEFIDKAKVPILWIDHHPITDESRKVDYFNPLKNDKEDNSPVSFWAYKITQKKNPENLWIAEVGCISDWYIPDFSKEFNELYPGLLNPEITNPSEALFDQKIGRLVKIFNSCLKGTRKKVNTCVKILSRITDPIEIMEVSSPKAKFINKHFNSMNERYDELINSVKKKKDELLVFTYDDEQFSFSAILSNEIQHRNPDKFIIVARKKFDFMHCSLRSQKHDVRSVLEKVLPEFEAAYGGGHKNACGANIRAEDFKHFTERIKQEMDSFKD